MKFLKRLWKDKSGVTAVEYGMIAAGIALVLITTVNTIGSSISTSMSSLASQL